MNKAINTRRKGFLELFWRFLFTTYPVLLWVSVGGTDSKVKEHGTEWSHSQRKEALGFLVPCEELLLDLKTSC